MQSSEDEKIIDVVAEFSASNQTEKYQEAFRDWRRREDNRFAFRFVRNTKEAAFAENQAVVSETPVQAEIGALRQLGTLFGYALLLYLIIENLIDKLLVHLSNAIGIHIETMYWGVNHYYGDDLVVFLFSAGMQLLKILVPTLMIGMTLKMPVRVSVPLHISNKRQFLSSISLMMLLSVGLGISLISRSSELEKYRMISDAAGAEDHWMILYMIFTIFIAPFFWELLFHSCMFQSLRQFGDGFAVGAVTLLAACLAHDLHDALRVGLVTLTISYFMIRTGSFLTAVVLRIIHEIYMFALYQIENFGGMYSVRWWVVVLFPCFVGLLTIIVLTIREKEEDTQLHPNPGYMELWDKASAFLTAFPMVIALIACMLLLVVSTMLG